MSESGYIGYQGMVQDVTASISTLSDVCEHLRMENQGAELQKIRKHLKEHIFSVGIMGEFRRGKSTLINALLGQNVLPADIIPTSATLNYVRWDTEKRAEVHFKDGRVETVSVDDLKCYVTKLTPEYEKTAAGVEESVVFYPCEFCQNGVQIVDTPGLNDGERMTAISEKVIPSLDAIIMVIVPDSPFSQSEAEFVRNKVMTSDLGRIMFVVNKIDMIDEDERERLLGHIRERIQESVLDKMGKIYGVDSEEYSRAKEKIGEIRLLPVSARNALKGKTKHDMSKLEESGYPEFEEQLSLLLTEERGLLELIHPVNQIMAMSKEALGTIDTRLKAMNLNATEFEQIQQDSMTQIQQTREQKKQEIDSLKSKSKTLYVDLIPEAEAAYAEISETLQKYVAEYPITENDIANKDAIEAFSKQFSDQLGSEIESAMVICTERLQHRIEERLGDDVEGLKGFAASLTNCMDGIRTNIASSSNAPKTSVLSNVTSMATGTLIESVSIAAGFLLADTFLPGIGSVILGIKNHGVKGIVGGLSGAAVAAIVGLLPIGGIGAIPCLLIMGAASAITSKTVNNLLFGPKKKDSKEQEIQNIRMHLLDAVNQAVTDMQSKGVLEKWLRETCDMIYTAVADNIDQEWENTLHTMEETLMQIKIDLQMNEEVRKNTETEMMAYSAQIQKLLDTIEPIRVKLSAALNG